jgi:hypothetical protein
MDAEAFAQFALNKANLSDYGLGFLFDVQKDLVLNSEFASNLYQVVAKIIKTKTKETSPVPEMPQPDVDGNEPSEDDRQNAYKRIEEVMKANQDIEKFNAEVSAIQAKVKVHVRPPLVSEEGGPGFPEVALMRLNNHRELKSEEAGAGSADTLR